MQKKSIKSIFRALMLTGLVASVSSVSTVQAEESTLKIATEGTFFPFNYKTPDGQLTGFDIDIANALCDQLKVKCEIIAQTWDGIIPGLQSKRYDVIVASMAQTPERAKKVLFTRPYQVQPSSFITAKSNHIQDVSPEALKGKIIGVQRGTSDNQWLLANGYDKTATLKLYDTTRQPELDLVAGRIDLMLASKIAASVDFFKRQESKEFEFVGPALTGGALGNGNSIAVRLEDKQLCDQLNGAIETIIANGQYEQIRKKYFDFPLL